MLFLSSDEKLQVRCNKSPLVFCVKDFVRAVSKKEISSDAANLYWLQIQLSELGERDLQNAHAVKFIGPLESEVICLGASGLLIILHHLDTRFGIVSKKYKAEIQNRLQEIANDKSAVDKYVWDHDDGELDALNAAMAKGEKFYSDDDDVLTDSTSDLLAAKINELEKKRARTESFSVRSLIEDLGMEVPEQYMHSICKSVVALFKKKFPEKEIYQKRNLAHFFKEDRPEVESILRQQVLKVQMIIHEREFHVLAPGAVPLQHV